MSHNGEINTLRGNVNWMTARQGVVQSDLFGESIEGLFPVVEPDCSDSGVFDNALEFLLMTGRTLQNAEANPATGSGTPYLNADGVVGATIIAGAIFGGIATALFMRGRSGRYAAYGRG